jgi:hypothetical protein
LHGGDYAHEQFELKDLTEFMTYETMTEGGFPHCLHGGAGRERNSKSRTTAKPSPPSAVVRRTILEFEFLSRIIASMQSMRWCRHDPAAVSYVFEPGQDDREAIAAFGGGPKDHP